MTVSINANAIVSSFWTSFKSIAITSKQLLVQYDDSDPAVYTIFAFDDRVCYMCSIWKGSIPSTALNSGYTQVQNDLDKSDFETNYKVSSNQRIDPKTPYNTVRVSQEASTLLADKFDQSSLDPAIWYSEANLVPPGITLNGNLQITTGTTASGYSVILSNPLFVQEGSAYLQFGVTLQFEYPTLTNMHRFWGFGTDNSNTAAAPLMNAVGFEIDTSANLNAVVYSNGTKIFSQTIANPGNGNFNRYSFTWRTDKIFFFVNSGETPLAVASFQIPQVQTLPARFHVINSTTQPSAGAVFKVAAIGVTDSARNNISISDGKYSWRQISVDASGAIPLQESGMDAATAPQRAIQLGATDADGILRALNAITDGGKLLAVQDESTNDLLREVLQELKMISFYLSQMVDIDLSNLE